MSLILALGVAVHASTAELVIGTFKNSGTGELFTLGKDGKVASRYARFKNTSWALSTRYLYILDYKNTDNSIVFSVSGHHLREAGKPKNEFNLIGKPLTVQTPTGWFREITKKPSTYLKLEADGSAICFFQERLPAIWLWDGTYLRVCVTIPQGWAYTLRPVSGQLRNWHSPLVFVAVQP